MSLWLDPAGGIPYLASEPRAIVIGELYFIPEASLSGLDKFEEHPLVYRRSEISVLHDGAPTPAFAYLYPHATDCFRLIESGDFAIR